MGVEHVLTNRAAYSCDEGKKLWLSLTAIHRAAGDITMKAMAPTVPNKMLLTRCSKIGTNYSRVTKYLMILQSLIMVDCAFCLETG